MTVRIGIIGGSGLYDMEGLTDVREVRVATGSCLAGPMRP